MLNGVETIEFESQLGQAQIKIEPNYLALQDGINME